MRQKKFFLLTIFLLISSFSCTTTIEQTRPIVTHRTWTNKSIFQIYDSCIRALHSSGIMIASESKDSGLISTDWIDYSAGDTRYRMRLSILALESTNNSVSVDIKGKYERGNPQYEYYKGPYGWPLKDLIGHIWEEINISDSEDLINILDDLFLEIQRYAGPSVTFGYTPSSDYSTQSYSTRQALNQKKFVKVESVKWAEKRVLVDTGQTLFWLRAVKPNSPLPSVGIEVEMEYLSKSDIRLYFMYKGESKTVRFVQD